MATITTEPAGPAPHPSSFPLSSHSSSLSPFSFLSPSHISLFQVPRSYPTAPWTPRPSRRVLLSNPANQAAIGVLRAGLDPSLLSRRLPRSSSPPPRSAGASPTAPPCASRRSLLPPARLRHPLPRPLAELLESRCCILSILLTPCLLCIEPSRSNARCDDWFAAALGRRTCTPPLLPSPSPRRPYAPLAGVRLPAAVPLVPLRRRQASAARVDSLRFDRAASLLAWAGLLSSCGPAASKPRSGLPHHRPAQDPL
ncbi:hypothetical protein VPH35_064632 [Triticum aestivum]